MRNHRKQLGRVFGASNPVLAYITPQRILEREDTHKPFFGLLNEHPGAVTPGEHNEQSRRVATPASAQAHCTLHHRSSRTHGTGAGLGSQEQRQLLKVSAFMKLFVQGLKVLVQD
jgi:hypothetical protein